MNWIAQSETAPSDDKYYDYSQLTEEEKIIIETLTLYKEGMVIDELSWKSQIPLNKLASQLLNLEFNGIVKTLPGKKYRLK